MSIFNYEIKTGDGNKNARGSVAKAAWKILAGFLILMILLSVIVRSIDSMSVARVSVQKPKQASISHKFSVNGTVSTNQEIAVSTVSGIKIASVKVKKGDTVKTGDLLYTLDTDSLEENYLKTQEEMHTLELQIADAAANKELTAEKQEITVERAQEDAEAALAKSNTAVARALAALEKAKKKLNEFNWSKYTGSSSASGSSGSQGSSSGEITSPEEGFSDGSGTDAILDQLDSDVASAQEKLNTAQTNLSTTQNYITSTVLQMFADNYRYATSPYGTVAGYTQAQDYFDLKVNDTASTSEMGTPEVGADKNDQLVDMAIANVRSNAQTVQEIINKCESYMEAKAAVETAQAALEAAKAAESTYASSQKSSSASSSEESESSAESAESAESAASAASSSASTSSYSEGVAAYNELVAAYNSAYDAYKDALEAAETDERTQQRNVDDAENPRTDVDTSTEYTRETDLELKKISFERLQKLKDAEGQITAECDAVITDVQIKTGEATPETTAVMLGDISSGFTFKASLTKDQLDYVPLGSQVTLSSVYNGSEVKVTALVTNIATSTENSESYDLTAELAEGTTNVGSSATLSVEKNSSNYSTVLPNKAVHEDSNGKYVFIISEESGILGTTLNVQKVTVTVQERDDDNSAVSGSLTALDQVIISSDRNLEAGDRVRLEDS